MKSNQAQASIDLLKSVLPTDASVKIWRHGGTGDDTPMGYIISVVCRTGNQTRQWMFHKVEQVGNFVRDIPPELKQGTPTPTTSHTTNGGDGNGERR